MKVHAAFVTIALAASFITASSASALVRGRCLRADCVVSGGGVDLATKEQLKRLGEEQASAIANHLPHNEYRTIDSCGTGGSLHGTDTCMTGAVTTLCPNPDEGPMADILVRRMGADGTPETGWRLLSRTCRANDVPGARPRPTMAMIVQAFHHTPWAKASIGFQPAGDVTLVNLPSFYQARWSAAGYGPGEVDTVDPRSMFGFAVQVRPRVESLVYHFGDGGSVGPTRSVGGVYPDGDIRHTYTRPGTFGAFVTVVWGADYRVGGGPWLPVPDTVSVDQPVTTITVKEARNHLVTR